MTVLIVGGAYQGKYDYACHAYHLTAQDFLPHEQVQDLTSWQTARAVNNLHLLLRDETLTTTQLLPQLQGKIVLCDQVGGGIVPLDPADRAWRERVGRLCCDLAVQADRVILVHMGIAQIIK